MDRFYLGQLVEWVWTGSTWDSWWGGCGQVLLGAAGGVGVANSKKKNRATCKEAKQEHTKILTVLSSQVWGQWSVFVYQHSKSSHATLQ